MMPVDQHARLPIDIHCPTIQVITDRSSPFSIKVTDHHSVGYQIHVLSYWSKAFSFQCAVIAADNCNRHNECVGKIAERRRRGPTGLPPIYKLVPSTSIAHASNPLIPENRILFDSNFIHCKTLETCQAGNKLARLAILNFRYSIPRATPYLEL
jgi:hypothetical protein